MKNLNPAIPFLVGAMLLAPIQAEQGPPASPIQGKQHMKMWEDLNLNADQKAKLKELQKQMRTSGKEMFDQMKNIRDSIKTELLNSKPSTSVLENFSAQIGELHRKLEQNHTDHMLQVKTILSPDQFAKVIAIKEKRKMHRAGKRGHRHPGGNDSCNNPDK